MTSTDKPEARGSITGNDKLEAGGFADAPRGAAEASANARDTISSARIAIESAKFHEWLASTGHALDDAPLPFEGAENAMLQDIDAILSRLENGIAKERQAMADLLERLRQRAA